MYCSLIAAFGFLFVSAAVAEYRPSAGPIWAWLGFWMPMAVAEFAFFTNRHLKKIQHLLSWLQLLAQNDLYENNPKAKDIMKNISNMLDPYYRPPKPQPAERSKPEPPRPPASPTVLRAEVAPEYPEEPPKQLTKPRPKRPTDQ